MEGRRLFCGGVGPDGCVIGSRSPPHWINSERITPVWIKFSHEQAAIAQAVAARRERAQPRPTGPGMGDRGVRISFTQPRRQVLHFSRLVRRNDAGGPGGLTAPPARAGGWEIFVAEYDSQDRRPAFRLLAGFPFAKAQS